MNEKPDLRDIAPPVDVFPYPAWVVVAVIAATVFLIVLAAWLIIRLASRKPTPAPSAHSITLAALQRAREQVAALDPYAFSILVSDILRDYLSARFGLPATKQTSEEFLRALENFAKFSADEKSLLAAFLEKCDLIKFAHVDATLADSETLLDQAVHFVNESAKIEARPATVESAA